MCLWPKKNYFCPVTRPTLLFELDPKFFLDFGKKYVEIDRCLKKSNHWKSLVLPKLWPHHSQLSIISFKFTNFQPQTIISDQFEKKPEVKPCNLVVCTSRIIACVYLCGHFEGQQNLLRLFAATLQQNHPVASFIRLIYPEKWLKKNKNTKVLMIYSVILLVMTSY